MTPRLIEGSGGLLASKALNRECGPENRTIQFRGVGMSERRGIFLSMISIRKPFKSEEVLEKLRYVQSEAGNVQGAGGDSRTIFSNYLKWVNEAVRILNPVVSSGDLDRLVTTKHYWVLRTSHPDSFEILRFLNYEVSERVRDLDQEVRELEETRRFWKWGNGFYIAVVPDTNFLLDYHRDLASIDWHLKLGRPGYSPVILCVPMVVVDELDNLKLSNKNEFGKEPLRKRARKALRMLEASLVKPGDRVKLTRSENDGIERSDVYLTMFTDGPGHLPILPNDAEVRDRAITLKPFASHVFIATTDLGMMFKSRYEDLDVCKFEDVQQLSSDSGKSSEEE